MSYREKIEEDIRTKIIAKLKENGGNFERSWLNPANYDIPVNFDNTLLPTTTRRHKFLNQVHSYEIIEMNDEDFEKYIINCCKKIEQGVFEIITSKDLSKKISYLEGNLFINIEYRITIIELEFNLMEW